MRVVIADDGTVHLSLTTREAGRLGSAIMTARPRGAADVALDGTRVVVYVTGDAAAPVPPHKPVEGGMP